MAPRATAVLRLGGLTVTEVNRLVAMRGRPIFISADGRSEVATATVANVRRIGGRAVNMVLTNIVFPGVAPAAADAFVSRFQGGLRVASGDVDGDGFAELVTAPGAAPAIPAATFGNATRIITIYSGNLAAVWQSVSLNVTAAFPGYSGGIQLTCGDEVVVATAAPAGTVVRTFSVAGGNFAAQSTFQARSYVEGDPQRRLRDVFANGASLAVGQIISWAPSSSGPTPRSSWRW